MFLQNQNLGEAYLVRYIFSSEEPQKKRGAHLYRGMPRKYIASIAYARPFAQVILYKVLTFCFSNAVVG